MLFGAPGSWGVRACLNPECGLAWLDPAPVEEDLHKAYVNYYTHYVDTQKTFRGPLRFLLSLTRRLFRIKAERHKLDLMWLHNSASGRLLEIGCGDGERLLGFQRLDWEVEGNDTDPHACKRAEGLGLKIQCGQLTDLGLPSNHFDAVIMNHVIEHLHNPVETLVECRRVLKPGGLLSVVTPNINGFGHRFFGSFWRGLEPPRHLRLYSVRSLARSAQAAGFTSINMWTTAARAEAIAGDSLRLLCKIAHSKPQYSEKTVAVAAMAFQLWATIKHLWDAESGDECVMIASK